MQNHRTAVSLAFGGYGSPISTLKLKQGKSLVALPVYAIHLSRQNDATAACEMATLRISVKSTAWVVTNESSIWWLIVARALGANTTVLAKPEGEVQVDNGLLEFVDCVYAPIAWRRRAEMVTTALETILTSSQALPVQVLGRNADENMGLYSFNSSFHPAFHQ